MPLLRRAHLVLDDDPTGVQTLAGVRVLLAADGERMRALLARGESVHLLTNTRALAPQAARDRVRAAVAGAAAAAPDVPVVLRGDSTLRAHLLEEYAGACEGLGRAGDPVPLLLVPALPAAGRVTLGGRHLLERDGVRVPLDETEYARDGGFAYASSDLLAWAQERSGGWFRRAAGRTVALAELRARGARVVADALHELAAGGAPAVLAPDVETDADLALVARGYADALAQGVVALVRCAPPFVGLLGGTQATGLVPLPARPRRLLLVCGSYVPLATRQLDALERAVPHATVAVDVAALAGEGAAAEQARVAERVERLLAAGGFAAVATPRERPARLRDLASGAQVASGLAAIVRRLDPRPEAIVSKGGITSAVLLSEGLGAREAEVVGPVAAGVARWRVEVGRDATDVLVVPGNVGDDELLARLVAGLLEEER